MPDKKSIHEIIIDEIEQQINLMSKYREEFHSEAHEQIRKNIEVLALVYKSI